MPNLLIKTTVVAFTVGLFACLAQANATPRFTSNGLTGQALPVRYGGYGGYGRGYGGYGGGYGRGYGGGYYRGYGGGYGRGYGGYGGYGHGYGGGYGHGYDGCGRDDY
jgi:hypothetical protein